MLRTITFAAALAISTPAIAEKEIAPFEVGLTSGLAVYCQYEPFVSNIDTLASDYVEQRTGYNSETLQEIEDVDKRLTELEYMQEVLNDYMDGMKSSRSIIESMSLSPKDCESDHIRSTILEKTARPLRHYYGY